MEFPEPLVGGTLVRRYKRFLADVTLDDGREVTAHVANSGSMKGLVTPGNRVWLLPSRDPKRKLAWTWELVEADGTCVGINTQRANSIAAEGIGDGTIAPLAGYPEMRREVRYGGNARIDLLLTGPTCAPCYVEVKNVTLNQDGRAAFPDAVTKRGQKHMAELAGMVAQGARAVVLLLVQRGDCDAFAPADTIDPAWGDGFRDALAAGVEALCYQCDVGPAGITVARPLPVRPRDNEDGRHERATGP